METLFKKVFGKFKILFLLNQCSNISYSNHMEGDLNNMQI